VDAALSVGVRVDDRPRELDQLKVIIGQLFGGDRHQEPLYRRWRLRPAFLSTKCTQLPSSGRGDGGGGDASLISSTA
jgi:hypothetical protein